MTDPTLSPEARREVLRDYGRRYGLTVLIETGTADGGTPAALMGDFKRVFTVERDANLHAQALARFDGTNVVCLHGDSAVVLADLLDILGDTPALLWLDGHACSGPSTDHDTPILGEVAAIFATGVPHVVLIDDLRCFADRGRVDGWHWPPFAAVAAMATAAGYDVETADDIARLTPAVMA